jgi:dUTP pyrophosphatase
MTSIKILHLPNACKDVFDKPQGSTSRIELVAAFYEPIVIRPRERAVVPTGLALELPSGWEGQIHSLPSIAIDKGLTVLNSPGTIDPDYRGEVQAILINLGENDVKIERGMPIAILSFAPFTRVTLVPTENLNPTERSSGGLGSTGR